MDYAIDDIRVNGTCKFHNQDKLHEEIYFNIYCYDCVFRFRPS